MQAAFPFLAPSLMPDFRGSHENTRAYVLQDLVRKLSPARFPGMPPTLVALTGFILGKVLHLHHRGRGDRQGDRARSGKWRHECQT